RLRKRSLSSIGVNLFFIFFLILAPSCAPCSGEQGEELFRNISAVAEELPEKSSREAPSRLPIIDVPRRDHRGEQVASITDHQVKFEAGEGSRCGSCPAWPTPRRPGST